MARAVVLLSGGLDSATTLAIARSRGFECYALSVDYGQRHRVELEAAARVAAALGAREHRTMRIDLAGIGGSALTDATIAVPEAPTSGIPVTYVPARNTTLLSLALAWAEVLDAEAVFVGVNAVDYSVSGDALVWLRTKAGARLVPIAEACALPEDEYHTLGLNLSTLQLEWRRVTGRHRHASSGKVCFRVRLERGRQIEVTEDHSLFTIDEQTGRIVPIRGSSLAIGTPLIVPFDLSMPSDCWRVDLSHIDLTQRRALTLVRSRQSSVVVADGFLTNRLHRTRVPIVFPVTDDFLRIVGLWLAEGGKDERSETRCLAFSIGGLPGAVDLLRRYFARFVVAVHKSPHNEFDYSLSSSVIDALFRRLGLFGTARHGTKKFPDWFWQLSQRQRRVMVAGLWDGDGCQFCHGEAPIFQKSHAIVEELYHCLALDGIFATVKPAAHSQSRLAITRATDLARFMEKYPLTHAAKRTSISAGARVAGREKATGLWKCEYLWKAVANAELAPGTKTSIYNAGGKYDVGFRAQRSVFAQVPALRQLSESKLAFLRVVSIERTAQEFMYDFSVEGVENFIANGVLAHNSGYPDCRPEFIAAFEALAARATRAGVEGREFHIHAPLIERSKAEIIREGARLGVDYALTVSCYQPDETGRACGRCDACRLRRAGFEAAGVPDPTRYRVAGS